ncbi:MAG: YbaB/EbfC family nucleoid-associated protein [Sedimentisphaerales bacterium]|nr:YbaB/EbfC family nucleoid-associated protein [Sedimentisphaerales bacterium]MBN2842965.1 YbaB/EbfC family nucleoid-associated protein [Sedimentisphaerales bacterium]
MFNFGNIAGMMGMLPKIKENMQQLQDEMKFISAEAASGGGIVTAKVNGKLELIDLKINRDIPGVADDLDMLEDLVKAAVNMAAQKAQEQVRARMAGKFGDMPGMDQLLR